MRVESFSNRKANNGLSFRQLFVTTSKSNQSEYVKYRAQQYEQDIFQPQYQRGEIQSKARDVIATAQDNGMEINSASVIKTPKDFQNNVNFFVLAAGEGSRFRPVARAIEDNSTEYPPINPKTGTKFINQDKSNNNKPVTNKLTMPIPVGNGKYITMLDFALQMSSIFAKPHKTNDVGTQFVSFTPTASAPGGSFSDIVAYYRKNPSNIKDVVVCCGDNVFGEKDVDLMAFFTKSINDPEKHLALVGAKKPAEVVANRFGVLKVGEEQEDGTRPLIDFAEKPSLAQIDEEGYRTPGDEENCVANTGMFYISKDAMKHLINDIEQDEQQINPDYIISKGQKGSATNEKYDFAEAVKYVHNHLGEWYGQEYNQGEDVKIVESWEDVGEPKAFCDFLEEIQDGEFTQNFQDTTQNAIRKSIKNRYAPENEENSSTFDVRLNRRTRPSRVHIYEKDGSNPMDIMA